MRRKSPPPQPKTPPVSKPVQLRFEFEERVDPAAAEALWQIILRRSRDG